VATGAGFFPLFPLLLLRTDSVIIMLEGCDSDGTAVGIMVAGMVSKLAGSMAGPTDVDSSSESEESWSSDPSMAAGIVKIDECWGAWEPTVIGGGVAVVATGARICVLAELSGSSAGKWGAYQKQWVEFLF